MSLGSQADGELYPEAERIKKEKFDGKVITITDATYMKKKDYYVCLATLGKKEITFGSGTAQTSQIKKMFESGEGWPQTVISKIADGKDYYVFKDVEEKDV